MLSGLYNPLRQKRRAAPIPAGAALLNQLFLNTSSIHRYASTRFPTKRTIAHSATIPKMSSSHAGTPSDEKIIHTSETPPTVKAYGIWVRTCSRWLQPVEVELIIEVSEIGEQWSPMTAPARMQDITSRSTVIPSLYA